MTDSSQSIESRARRLASKVDHQQLLQHAEQLQKEGSQQQRCSGAPLSGRKSSELWRAVSPSQS
jgi:hypothetical protein